MEKLGRLDDHTREALSTLQADGELHLQLTYSTTPLTPENSTKPPRGTVGFLSTILYGPRGRLYDVGYFTAQCGHYLEDPLGCDRNVPYLNPQCLSSIYEEPPMTFDLINLGQHQVDDFMPKPCDLLAGFETTDELGESHTPNALCTQLKSFVNIISGRSQPTPPPVWRGGILADEMGLGKTLSMIALVASDQDENDKSAYIPEHKAHPNELHSTLIVVPLSLLSVWENQLKTHTHARRVTWFNHHGKQRLQLSRATSAPDIVFTTYQTVESESRNKTLKAGSVFSYFWRRIILDEAHIIRNHKTSTARAISSLSAWSRWAISGTPVQNELTDFLGLFSALRFKPYHEPAAFDEDISDLWRNKPVDKATSTFKKLLSCVMIRRTKAIISLPPREDKIVRLSFNAMERERYRRVESPVAEMLDDTADTTSTGSFWLSSIQQINKLRIICNLGIHDSACTPNLPVTVGGSILMLLATRLSIGSEMCTQCLKPIDSSPSGRELEISAPSTVYYAGCYRFFCASCAILLRYQTPGPCGCTDRAAPCLLRPLPLLTTPTVSPGRSVSPTRTEIGKEFYLSSKVQAVISEIRSYPNQKNVIFSSWTSSLDMVQRGLVFEGIRFVRIDGKVATPERTRVIKQFQSDFNTRAILVTISCGACGLDLTAASRIHLLEPQWNPSLEDQALARAHRLGQEHPVTTLRYVIRDSIEEVSYLHSPNTKRVLSRMI
ncbi:hypothetical protein BS50DRAFT_504751 [Corynespora cassiicola Philippines]|uniref:Uncharacterized protein n=1 Tax=Corynespora cassiicola Philippines TaxID=1448308 RepID=A0A2T2N8H8_CORCC|nr:hypothetical protein BS50DRAFT_504751 [Corynespora cassiicola Philippines]